MPARTTPSADHLPARTAFAMHMPAPASRIPPPPASPRHTAASQMIGDTPARTFQKRPYESIAHPAAGAAGRSSSSAIVPIAPATSSALVPYRRPAVSHSSRSSASGLAGGGGSVTHRVSAPTPLRHALEQDLGPRNSLRHFGSALEHRSSLPPIQLDGIELSYGDEDEEDEGAGHEPMRPKRLHARGHRRTREEYEDDVELEPEEDRYPPEEYQRTEVQQADSYRNERRPTRRDIRPAAAASGVPRFRESTEEVADRHRRAMELTRGSKADLRYEPARRGQQTRLRMAAVPLSPARRVLVQSRSPPLQRARAPSSASQQPSHRDRRATQVSLDRYVTPVDPYRSYSPSPPVSRERRSEHERHRSRSRSPPPPSSSRYHSERSHLPTPSARYSTRDHPPSPVRYSERERDYHQGSRTHDRFVDGQRIEYANEEEEELDERDLPIRSERRERPPPMSSSRRSRSPTRDIVPPSQPYASSRIRATSYSIAAPRYQSSIPRRATATPPSRAAGPSRTYAYGHR